MPGDNEEDEEGDSSASQHRSDGFASDNEAGYQTASQGLSSPFIGTSHSSDANAFGHHATTSTATNAVNTSNGAPVASSTAAPPASTTSTTAVPPTPITSDTPTDEARVTAHVRERIFGHLNISPDSSKDIKNAKALYKASKKAKRTSGATVDAAKKRQSVASHNVSSSSGASSSSSSSSSRTVSGSSSRSAVSFQTADEVAVQGMTQAHKKAKGKLPLVAKKLKTDQHDSDEDDEEAAGTFLNGMRVPVVAIKPNAAETKGHCTTLGTLFEAPSEKLFVFRKAGYKELLEDLGQLSCPWLATYVEQGVDDQGQAPLLLCKAKYTTLNIITRRNTVPTGADCYALISPRHAKSDNNKLYFVTRDPIPFEVIRLASKLSMGDAVEAWNSIVNAEKRHDSFVDSDGVLKAKGKGRATTAGRSSSKRVRSLSPVSESEHPTKKTRKMPKRAAKTKAAENAIVISDDEPHTPDASGPQASATTGPSSVSIAPTTSVDIGIWASASTSNAFRFGHY
ncbi:hypothetical protein BDZ89DRAFT_1132492 [Hymenopellis radicata]|nr:hypothetical protein BDZ89DRAFT_1132492 [Hymenopellis radicata]